MAPQLVDYFESLACSGLTTRRRFSILMFLPWNMPAPCTWGPRSFPHLRQQVWMHGPLHTALTPTAHPQRCQLNVTSSATSPDPSPSSHPLSDFSRERQELALADFLIQLFTFWKLTFSPYRNKNRQWKQGLCFFCLPLCDYRLIHSPLFISLVCFLVLGVGL